MQWLKIRPLRKSAAILFVLVLSLKASPASPLTTPAQVLRGYGLSLAIPDLVVALKDRRSGVRLAASMELSESKAIGEVLAIMEAAAIEKDDLVQAEMFEATLDLNSLEAVQPLSAICLNTARSGQSRLVAARALFGRGNRACFASSADMMLPSQTPDDRIGAWYMLSQRRDRTLQETKLVLDRLLVALLDQDPHLRLEASTGLRFLRDPAAAEPLRRAILIEADNVIRDQMQGDLASLTAAQP